MEIESFAAIGPARNELSQSSDKHLPPDLLSSVFGWLDCKQLARAACSCGYWRLVALSESLWQNLSQLEFGYLSDPPASHSWLQHFNTQRVSADSKHSAAQARCQAILSQVENWDLSVDQWVGPAALSNDQHAMDLQQSTVSPCKLCLVRPQSIWLWFSLPSWVANTELNGQQFIHNRLCVDARTRGGHFTAITSLDFRMPQDDFNMLLLSHTEGLYAWDASDPEQGPLPVLDGQGGTLPVDSELQLMVYIHYEQLLQACTLPLPQVLPLPAPPHYGSWMEALQALHPAKGHCLTLHMDFARVHAPGLLGSCNVRLHASHWSQHGGITLWPAEPDDIAVTTASGFSPPENAGQPPVRASGAVGQQLAALAATECMADFAIHDREGRLLLGRAGVELWDQENVQDQDGDLPQDRRVCWDLHFLVDGGEAESLWSNAVHLDPAPQGCAWVKLKLTWEALGRILRIPPGAAAQTFCCWDGTSVSLGAGN